MDSHQPSFQAWAWRLFLVTWFFQAKLGVFVETNGKPASRCNFLLQQKAKRLTECLLQGSHVFVELPPTMTGWWFQIFFIFTPKIGEDSHFDLFSKGLKPPSSMSFMKVWEGPFKKVGS